MTLFDLAMLVVNICTTCIMEVMFMKICSLKRSSVAMVQRSEHMMTKRL